MYQRTSHQFQAYTGRHTIHRVDSGLQVACQLLQYSQGRAEQGSQVMRALAAAAQAALAVNATTTAAVAEALVAAEDSAAGVPSRYVTLLWSVVHI